MFLVVFCTEDLVFAASKKDYLVREHSEVFSAVKVVHLAVAVCIYIDDVSIAGEVLVAVAERM